MLSKILGISEYLYSSLSLHHCLVDECIELKDSFDVKKLVPKIACPDVGLYHECLYGFLYDGKEVEVEFTGDTIGKTRTFYLIEPTFNDDDGLISYDIAKDWYM